MPDNQELTSKELESMKKAYLDKKHGSIGYNQELTSKELDAHKGDDLSGRVTAFMNGRYGQTQAVVDLVGALWQENQHLRKWMKENTREESEWATKYMQTKEQLTTTQQKLAMAVEALRFYADNKHWYEGMACTGSNTILREHGEKAKAALASIKEKL